MKILTYLNMHRSRLGYVNCVVLVADTQLDTALGIRRRLEQLLFVPVEEGSQGFLDFAPVLRPGALDQLDKQAAKRSLRRAKRTRQGVESQGSFRGPRSFNIADLWLLERDMRSHTGRILREELDEPIELCKDLGFLSPGYALTELGHLLKLFLLDQLGDISQANAGASPNPLVIYDNARVRLLYLYALLQADAVFPLLLKALSDCWDVENALSKALDDIAGRSEGTLRLDEISELKNVLQLRERIRKVRTTADGSTEKPVDKAQRVPRLEYAVDLGFLDRGDNRGPETGGYHEAKPLEHVRLAFEKLLADPTTASRWADDEFFGAAGTLYGQSLRPCDRSEMRLLYFVRGCTFLKRRIGFIPGRVAALAGCIFGWEEGWRLEVAQLFREAYAVPKGKWAKYIQFSGGSRLDSEFLVVVDPALEQDLNDAIRDSGKA